MFSPAASSPGTSPSTSTTPSSSGLATGQFPDEHALVRAHGPDFLLKRIKAPTLIAQGTVDTLFDLDQAHRNFIAR